MSVSLRGPVRLRRARGALPAPCPARPRRPLPTTPAPAVRPAGHPDQPAAQRRLQGETEQVARRLGTMIRFLAYHRLEPGRRAEAPRRRRQDARRADQERDGSGHRPPGSLDQGPGRGDRRTPRPRRRTTSTATWSRTSRALLLKYDTIKTLDQAAERLERGARDQNEQRLEALALAQQLRDRPDPRPRRPPPTATEQADTQGDLTRDLESLFKQLEKLPPFLTPSKRNASPPARRRRRARRSPTGRSCAETLLQQNDAGRRRPEPADRGRGSARAGPRPAGPRATSWRR